MKTRDDAWALLQEFTKNDGLLKHALAVEAAMRAYARRYEESEEVWGMAGLLHDFDYERYPALEDHARKGAEVLRERGYSEDVVYAVLSHSDYTGVERTHQLDKALYAVDELTGLVVAVALVRPTKSIVEVDARAVRRKWRDKAFARGVNREDIERGVQDLGVDLDAHIDFVIQAMQGIASELGLAGMGAV
jgi:putative nucleotidyltransferase with HDIG domain